MSAVRVKLRGSGKEPVDVALSSPKATVGELKSKLSPKLKVRYVQLGPLLPLLLLQSAWASVIAS